MKNRNITPFYSLKVVENIVSLRRYKIFGDEYNIEIWPLGEVFAHDFCYAFCFVVVYLCRKDNA